MSLYENIYKGHFINSRGHLEEVQFVLGKEKREEGKTKEEKYRASDEFFKNLERTLLFLSGGKIIEDTEEEEEESYNVSVYRVLPYPPNTKDAKDFFVQRT